MTTKEKYSKEQSITNQNTSSGEKSPAFQFYPKDVLSDGNAMAMPAEAFGIYMRLLCFDWVDDGLSDHDGKLMRLGGFNPFDLSGEERDEEHYETIWQWVRGQFIDHPTKPGYITNSRLLKERANQEERRRKNKENADKRWGNSADATASPSHKVRIYEEDAKRCPSSSSSSSTSSSTASSIKNTHIRSKKVSVSKESFGHYQQVKLSNDEYQSLLNDLGNETLENLITDLDGYIEAKGATYKNHAAAIRNWHRRKAKEPITTGKNKQTYFDKWSGILEEAETYEP